MLRNDDELGLMDSFGRVIRKLRLSVVDKCNFSCNFCMPDKPEWLPNEKVLTVKEIVRLVAILSGFGVDRVRVTGGEPLVRKDIDQVVANISEIPGIHALGMTTNGFYLAEKAKALRAAGLGSVTVSLHSLHPERFAAVTRRDVHVKVIQGIRAAKNEGFKNIKLNSVVIRGYNDDEILDFAEMAYTEGFNVRFIEYMPFDGKKMWDTSKVVTGEEILAKIKSKFEIVPLEREHGSTAMNYRFIDGGGEFGIITSISKPFCSDCDRLRITADGKVVPCLFSKNEYDIGSLLRRGASDAELKEFFRKSVKLKAPGVESLINGNVPLKHVRPMYMTGG
ncbi:MAG: GTP 3',8-cyclase MoaA [Nitrososphaerales archaeon]